MPSSQGFARTLARLLLALQRFVLDALLPPILLIGLVANLPTALLLEKDQAEIKLLAGAVMFPTTWLGVGALAAWSGTAIVGIHPSAPDLPWATAAIAALLSAGGGVLLLAHGHLSRHWGRALPVRFRRRIARHRVERLPVERRAIFDEAETLARNLDLPGINFLRASA